MDWIDTFVFRSTLCFWLLLISEVSLDTSFLLGFPLDCLIMPLILCEVLFVAKNTAYLLMMDWSSPSQLPLGHLVLFILFRGLGQG